MSALLNEFVFDDAKAPIKDVEIEIHDGHLRQPATLNKKVKIQATLEGDLSTTPDGKIRFHPSSIKAGGAPVKGLLDLFDVELDEMIKTQPGKGVSVVENDLLLDPERLLPPPRIRGKVTAVRLERDRIVQVFGGGRKRGPLSPLLPRREHYMFFRGGELAFGKLTMHGADLQIIDADPDDPFDFFLSEFARQLVAGIFEDPARQGSRGLHARLRRYWQGVGRRGEAVARPARSPVAMSSHPLPASCRRSSRCLSRRRKPCAGLQVAAVPMSTTCGGRAGEGCGCRAAGGSGSAASSCSCC